MVMEAAAAWAAAEKAELQQKIREIEGKLRRLRSARDALNPAKETVKDLRNGVKKNRDPDSAWRGAKSKRYETDMDSFYSDYKQYYSCVDSALSSVKWKIAQLEIERGFAQTRLAALELVS